MGAKQSKLLTTLHCKDIVYLLTFIKQGSVIAKERKPRNTRLIVFKTCCSIQPALHITCFNIATFEALFNLRFLVFEYFVLQGGHTNRDHLKKLKLTNQITPQNNEIPTKTVRANQL